MIRTAPMAYFLGVGLLILAGCVGSNQQELPTPTIAPDSVLPATPTPDSVPTPAATPTPSPIPIPTSTETTPTLDINRIAIVTLLPKDAIRAILDPQFTSSPAASMPETFSVIGVSINGDARAYPINILSRHEIVNDVVGGESIAVTW